MSFTGAPAAFPVQAENVALSKYLVYNDAVTARGDKFIKEKLAHGPYVGIHLRNGPDWVCRKRYAHLTRDCVVGNI